MTLRQHLRSDEDCRCAAANVLELRLEPALAACGVAIDAMNRRVRKRLAQPGFRALRADTDRHESVAFANGTELGNRAPRAAMVTSQPPRRGVQRHPRIAAPADRLPAARGTQVGRRVTAPIDKHQHLVTGVQMSADTPLQALTDAVAQPMATNVDDVESRHCRAGRPASQLVPVVPAGIGIVEALERRRGTAENQWNAQGLGAFHRNVSGRVA